MQVFREAAFEAGEARVKCANCGNDFLEGEIVGELTAEGTNRVTGETKKIVQRLCDACMQVLQERLIGMAQRGQCVVTLTMFDGSKISFDHGLFTFDEHEGDDESELSVRKDGADN